MLELNLFSDPHAAKVEVEVEDVQGGRGESRVEAVFRQLRQLFKQQNV